MTDLFDLFCGAFLSTPLIVILIAGDMRDYIPIAMKNAVGMVRERLHMESEMSSKMRSKWKHPVK